MKRPQISLRLLLLVVALFAVVFAWLSARRDLRQLNTRARIEQIELHREYALGNLASSHPDEGWRSLVVEMDAEIAKLKQQQSDAL